MRIVTILAALTTLALAAAPQAPPGPQQNPPAAQQQNAPTAQQQVPVPASGSTIKTNTRLIAVDVIATDSHGSAVRGLKADDFQVTEEHAGPQKIVKFEFVDASATPPPAPSGLLTAAAPGAPYIYSNLLPERMRVPPTVMLMDALNTNIQNQSEVHQHMLALLKTLPPSTPIAVFVLGRTLHVVQSFTTDPALLRAAVDHTLRAPDIEQSPEDDPNSPSNVALDQNGDVETPATQALEDFERTEFEAQMAIRVDETTDAMVSIAKFLGGYPGRKNLLWFSESFPAWIEPSEDMGTNPFNGSAVYTDKIKNATDALTDARIAVYPVDARGLEVSNLYSSGQNPHMNRNAPGFGLGGQISRDNTQRLDAQATMQQFAEETGGKTCLNTNDLSGCVQGALDDSSTYYELAYYPENVKWDGRFHKLTVKTNQHGVKLRYRSGYFATQPDAQAKQPPAKLLQQACMDPLPSTSISLTAESLTPKQGASDAGAARYLLTISPNSLSLPPAGANRQMSLQMAICEFDPKGASFQFFPRDLSGPVSEAAYQNWRSTGIRNIFDYAAKPDDRRLRFVVLDVPSGATGTLDVPAHPHAFGNDPGGAGLAPSAGNSAAANAPAEAPAGQPASPPPTHVAFRIPSGASSMLDWTGDHVSYHGELSIDQGARALFQTLFSSRDHCEAGSLVPNDISSIAAPNLVLTLTKPGGTHAVIDLGGSAPEYSGEVPVDSSGRAFFDYLWKLAHCQQP
ncbi:MAG TPA: VWA domain-containing protein [Candidatus Acidoferrales bacterium]|nr:VWA domain-containing protein [Candidatus Acidoferrales bacterium]